MQLLILNSCTAFSFNDLRSWIYYACFSVIPISEVYIDHFKVLHVSTFKNRFLSRLHVLSFKA